MSFAPRPTTLRIRVAASSVLFVLAVGLVACGGGGDGDNQNDGPETTSVPVKNMRLNDCVSVISGDRPKPGVTVPRCVPTTLPGNPNKPKKG